ncbi:cell division protein FtsA [Anaplasma capra]|uniref:cell division protein FtsA n=1 Tax=Anaplasma capra TaxID=1562740 RepID=UPI0037C08CC0
MTEPRKGVFAVLDMGSTKMVCLAVKVHNDGEPEVIGVGYKAADGIHGGAITNKQHAGYSILSSIDAAEQVSEHTMNQVYVSISGCNISSHNVSNEMNSTVHEISDRDIRRIMLQTYEKFSGDDIVVHNVPVAYHLDDLKDVTELKGLYGSRLRADMHVVTASKLALLNIENCITNNNISMGGCVAEPYVSGLACLTEDEREMGTMILDIGGNYTSIGLFDKGKFVYASTIPLGGVHVTRDMAYGLCTSVRDAERIKILHGNIILTSADKNYAIETETDDGDRRSVMKSDLASIIRPRIEEILELVRQEIGKQQHVINKVVITGGCSNLASIREITNYVLNKQVRIGVPVHINGMSKEYDRNPIFSAAVGTALLVVNSFYRGINRARSSSYGKIRRILRWIADKSEV